MPTFQECIGLFKRRCYAFWTKYYPHAMPRFYKYGLTVEDVIGFRNTPWIHEGYTRLAPEQKDEFIKRAVIAEHRAVFDNPFPVSEWVKPEEEKTVLIDSTLIVLYEDIQKMYWNKV